MQNLPGYAGMQGWETGTIYRILHCTSFKTKNNLRIMKTAQPLKTAIIFQTVTETLFKRQH